MLENVLVTFFQMLQKN